MIRRFLLSACFSFCALLCHAAVAQMPTSQWIASPVKAEVEAFLSSQPSFPCKEHASSDTMAECLIDWLFSRKDFAEFPAFGILALGNDEQIAEMIKRLKITNPKNPIIVPALLTLGRIEEAENLIKQSYDRPPNMLTKDLLDESIYALVDANKLDAAIALVKLSPALIAYKREAYKKGYKLYICRGCDPPDDPIADLTKALILADRIKEAEEISTNFTMAGASKGECSGETFARFAYYSRHKAIHSKHLEYCDCRINELKNRDTTVKVRSAVDVLQLMKANCTELYPSTLEELDKLKWPLPICPQNSPDCIKTWNELKGRQSSKPKSNTNEGLKVSEDKLEPARLVDVEGLTNNELILKLYNQTVGTQGIAAVLEVLNKRLITWRQSAPQAVFLYNFQSHRYPRVISSLITRPEYNHLVSEFWPLWLGHCAYELAGCGYYCDKKSDVTAFHWQGTEAVYSQCVARTLDGLERTSGPFATTRYRKFESRYPPLKSDIDVYGFILPRPPSK